MSVSIRLATAKDSESIANLHANSWRMTYRGILSDEYLDNNLEAERLQYWKPKIDKLKSNEFVLLAESENKAVGFIALMDRPDAGCDAFIDNLHVRGDVKGRGIGGKLMKAAAERLKETNRYSFYLWVLNGNDAAAVFYKSKGAITEDTTSVVFGGKEILQTRFVWKTLSNLL